MIDSKEVKRQAAGYWGDIVMTLAPELIPAVQKKGRHVPCPIHGGKDGFRILKDFNVTGGGICNTCGAFADGLGLIQWANGWSFYETLKNIHEFQNGRTLPTTSVKRVTAKIEYLNDDRNQKKIDQVLLSCKPMGLLLSRYLKHRGLGALSGRVPADLLAIDRLPYWENVDGKYRQLGAYPAMIGIIRNLSGDVVTLHRTYLTPEGTKASVSSPKKIMSPRTRGASAGCAIQLFNPTEDLAITEGIETALAVHLSTGLPVWAAISSTMLEKIQIPSTVKNVFIMADKDRSGAGVAAANKLACRLAGRHRVKVVIPQDEINEQAKSVDWLDVYIREQLGMYECAPSLVGGNAP